jgi:hypothetical protein
MKRSFLACISGLVVWVVFVTIINRILRITLPGYTAAEMTMAFTLSMKWARLLMAIVTSITAGAVTRCVSPAGRWPPWIVGFIVLAMFLPLHISIWSRFPLWYHLSFLIPIVPCVLAGALLGPRPQQRAGQSVDSYS